MEAGVLNKLGAKNLKVSDVAHLTEAMRELTFILEKNGFLKTSDREHINSKLDI